MFLLIRDLVAGIVTVLCVIGIILKPELAVYLVPLPALLIGFYGGKKEIPVVGAIKQMGKKEKK